MKRFLYILLLEILLALAAGFIGIQVGIRLAEHHVMSPVPLRIPSLSKE